METNNIYKIFETNIAKFNKKEYLQKLINFTDPIIQKVKNFNLKNPTTKNKNIPNDFGISHHSSTLDFKKFNFFYEDIIFYSKKFCELSGFNIKNLKIFVKDCWVQEFGSLAGHHLPHIHTNSHINGFYFLKCTEKTSCPTFYDPRISKALLKLPQKNINDINSASDIVHFKPIPGDFIVFPSYLNHGFSVDTGEDPFRFIHFNLLFYDKNI